MEDTLRDGYMCVERDRYFVLILVLMEDTLRVKENKDKFVCLES